jgi:16S rRNA (cytosine967-C5)-methyltransferase
MSPRSLLEAAAELLRAVLRLDGPADAAVAAYFRKHGKLGARERRTLTETVYAVLRERLLLEHLARSGAGPLERRLAILGWRGDASFLQAAIGEPERTWLAQAHGIDRTALPEPLRHNLPDWLAAALRKRFGDELFWPLAAALAEPAPLDLRINPMKTRREDTIRALAAAGVRAEPTRYSPWGLRVDGKPALQRTAPFESGAVEVQDEGSQLLALLVDAKRGEMVVDFCAGAGGKTLALAAAMRNTGRLYAFDVSAHRLDALKPRLERGGLSNVYFAQIAHEHDDRIRRLAGKADRVLVDAPCSGLGTLRRNPELKWRQSPESVAESAAKQRSILAAAARLLKPGGRLVYATCSLLAEENEAVVEDFEREQGARWAAVGAEPALRAAHVGQAHQLVSGRFLRLLPNVHATDGFFAAAWQRDK